MLGADSNTGQNQLVWKGGSKYWVTKHDANWNSTGSAYVKPGTAGFYQLETEFEQDLDKDSVIGAPKDDSSRGGSDGGSVPAMTELEGKGTIALHVTSNGLGYAKDGAGELSAIRYGLSLIHISEPTRPY